ncbi:hypothetical protein [Rhizobium sp. A37_96]
MFIEGAVVETAVPSIGLVMRTGAIRYPLNPAVRGEYRPSGAGGSAKERLRVSWNRAPLYLFVLRDFRRKTLWTLPEIA